MSVLGQIWTDRIGALLGTNYKRFKSPTGLNGLAKSSGDRLDILAVDATQPGTGQFRRFIKRAKQEYKTICIWEVWNKDLEGILGRYEFNPCDENDPDTHEHLTGYRWNADDKDNDTVETSTALKRSA